MELKEVQISEIKNLNLIYVFTTDSIFKNGSNKYVGAKVVFENNTKAFALDYRDKHFQKFIKRILERYHKEKDKRKIILLGDLTKHLISDSSFAVLEKVQNQGLQTVGIPSFNTSDREVKKQEPFLKEAMEMILKVYKNYEVLSVDSIDGFNKKYVVSYSIGSIKKKMPVIISKRDDGIIDFKLSRLEDKSCPISGTLVNDGGKVEINWKDETTEINGHILYDPNNNISEKKVTSSGQTIIYDEGKDTLLEEDISLIKFYFDLCEMQIPKKIIKVGDSSYLLSEETDLNDDEKEILYSNTSACIDVLKDEVRISYHVKNCFSKYKNQINTVLDQETEEVTFRKLNVDSKQYILAEIKTKTDTQEETYKHRVFEVGSDVDFRKTFEFTSSYYSDRQLNTIEDAKQLTRAKGGKK